MADQRTFHQDEELEQAGEAVACNLIAHLIQADLLSRLALAGSKRKRCGIRTVKFAVSYHLTSMNMLTVHAHMEMRVSILTSAQFTLRAQSRFAYD